LVTRAFHILLAFSLLFSTTGITISKHFCRNVLVDTALFVRAKACGMTAHQDEHASGSQCDKHPEKTTNGCCKDQSEYHQLDQDQQITLQYFKQLLQPIVLALPWPAVMCPPVRTSSDLLAYLHYRPPLIFEPVQARLQVFRI
jgi:hypothetical protein